MRLRDVHKLLSEYRHRINLLVTRGIATMVNAETHRQSLQVKSIGGELLDPVEHFESYGFTSHPHRGSESLLLSLQGNRSHTVAICVADRRYRLTGLAEGEVALHDDQGNVIHLMRDQIKIEAVQHLEVSAPTCRITATTTHEGDLTINGALTVNGNINIVGDIVADGISLKNHTHPENNGGNTGAPN